MSDKYQTCPNCGGPMIPTTKRVTTLTGIKIRVYHECLVCGALATRSKSPEPETKRKTAA